MPVVDLKIDCGRTTGGTASGWVPDNYAAGGLTYTYGFGSTYDLSGLTNPAPIAVYDSTRYDAASYTLTGYTPGAQVKIRVHLTSVDSTAGQRVFNIAVNGAVPSVFSNIDTYTLAGGVYKKGLILEYLATANSSGAVTVATVNITNYAVINGLEATEIPDTTAPSVSITSPASGATVSGNLDVTATASDNVAVASVQFKLGSTVISTDSTSPYSATINTVLYPNGTYTLFAVATDTSGNQTTSAGIVITIYNDPALVLLPHGFPSQFAELFCEPELEQLGNGQSYTYMADFSLKNRTLAAGSSPPSCARPIINGRAVVRFNGSNSPMSNSATFKINCGWIVAKYNGDTFSGYQGLLTDLQNQGILVGNGASANFYDFLDDYYEYRANDKIYPPSAAKGAMNAFKVLFFRYWKPVTVNGIQIGQDRGTTSRRWNGDIALLALYSRNFCEEDIRKYTKILADLYAINLADVYPYQADKISPESSAQAVNFYDPPEGNRIAESIEVPNRQLDLKFSSRRTKEIKAMKAFHAAHFASATPCIYRDYSIIPPEDVQGYIDSEYEKTGAVNNFNYSFSFRENQSTDPVLASPPAANFLEVVDSSTGLVVVQEI